MRLITSSNAAVGQKFSPNGYGLIETHQKRAENGDLSPIGIEHANEICSYQSQTSSKMIQSERNPHEMKKTDSVEKLRSIPRSFTNPEKMSNQNSNSKRSPLQNFMVDDVWPTNSSRRQRTSSITSLTNSTPGSRTLEQL